MTGCEWAETRRLVTGNPTIYDVLVKEEQLFNTNFHLFAFGLIYGILYNKKDKETKKGGGFITITSISDPQIKDLLDIAYLLLDDGSGTEKIFDEMIAYADGGIIALNEIYKKNKSFTIPNLILDAEEKWKERAKELENINLTVSKSN